MNQEKLMKAKLVSTIITLVISLIALLVFIGLYIDEVGKTEETYKKQYIGCVRSAYDDIDDYIKIGTDLEMRYNLIISDIGSARTVAFLIKDYEKQQIAMNELNFCIIKYPEQSIKNLDSIRKALNDIIENKHDGYEKLETVVNSIDKKGS